VRTRVRSLARAEVERERFSFRASSENCRLLFTKTFFSSSNHPSLISRLVYVRSFVRSFVRSASFPLLSTSSPSSSRGEIFVIFSHITFTHAKRYDTNTPHKFLRARVSVGLIKHQSCHQNPLARRLHLRFLKLRRRRRPMGFHRFPKTAS